MPHRVELVFDFVSPNAYLIWWPLRELLDRYEAELDVVPVFLGGMHKLTGNAPPMIRDKDVKGKNEYAMLEMQRFIAGNQPDNLGIPFHQLTFGKSKTAGKADIKADRF